MCSKTQRYRDSTWTKHAPKPGLLKQLDAGKASGGSGRAALTSPITAGSVGHMMVSHMLEVSWYTKREILYSMLALTAAHKTHPDPEAAEASNNITFAMKQKHFDKLATSLSSVADGFFHAKIYFSFLFCLKTVSGGLGQDFQVWVWD